MDLDDLLDDVTVSEVDEYHVATNREYGKDLEALLGWWMVTDGERGAFAYFASETGAAFFRLALINARLNNIAGGK